MATDVVLKDNAIELVDAKVVRVTNANGSVTVQISGRLVADDSISATDVIATQVTVGTSAPGEPKKIGRLVVRGVRGGGDVILTRGLVSAPNASVASVETASIIVGQGAAGEPRRKGIVSVRNERGAAGVTLDGAGDIKLPVVGSLRTKIVALERRLALLERRR